MLKKNKVFLDSSVILAALLSSRGGSFYIISEMGDEFILQISEYVFDEVRDVIERKYKNDAFMQNKLFSFISFAKVIILKVPPKKDITPLEKLVERKDSPVLASAILHSDYLITLDKGFLKSSVIEFAEKRGLQILTPRDFVLKFKE